MVRLYVWSLMVLVALVVLFYNVELWRGKRAWARVVLAAQAAGQTLDIDSLAPASVPDDQNFAMAPMVAPLFTLAPDALQETLKPWRESFSSSCRSEITWLWQQPFGFEQRSIIPPAFRSVSSASRSVRLAECRTRLETVEAGLQAISEASKRPQAVFPLHHERNLLGNFRAIGAVQLQANALLWRCLARLDQGQVDAAFEDWEAALRVAHHLHSEPLAWEPMYRLALFGVQPVWEGLKERRWNARQLEKIQEDLAAWHPAADYQRVCQIQILMAMDTLEILVPARSVPLGVKFERADERLEESDRWALHMLQWIYPRGWSLRNQACMHRFLHEQLMGLTNEKEPRFDLEKARVAMQWFRENAPSLDLFFKVYFLPRIHELGSYELEKYACLDASLTMARTACALERYWMEHQAYPEALNELTPKYLERLPMDGLSGEPLHYRRHANGRFILYSVGRNRVDDGGTAIPAHPDQHPTLDWTITPDWVWQY